MRRSPSLRLTSSVKYSMWAARAVSAVAPLALSTSCAAAGSRGLCSVRVATNVSYSKGVTLLNVTLVDGTTGVSYAMSAVQVSLPNQQTINGEALRVPVMAVTLKRLELVQFWNSIFRKTEKRTNQISMYSSCSSRDIVIHTSICALLIPMFPTGRRSSERCVRDARLSHAVCGVWGQALRDCILRIGRGASCANGEELADL